MLASFYVLIRSAFFENWWWCASWTEWPHVFLWISFLGTLDAAFATDERWQSNTIRAARCNDIASQRANAKRRSLKCSYRGVLLSYFYLFSFPFFSFCACMWRISLENEKRSFRTIVVLWVKQFFWGSSTLEQYSRLRNACTEAVRWLAAATKVRSGAPRDTQREVPTADNRAPRLRHATLGCEFSESYVSAWRGSFRFISLLYRFLCKHSSSPCPGSLIQADSESPKRCQCLKLLTNPLIARTLEIYLMSFI